MSEEKRARRPERPRTQPLDENERDFIRATFPQLSVSAIAERLGRSRETVNKFVRDEGLREGRQKEPAPQPDPGPAPEGTAARLTELRDRLRAALMEASPKEVAPLAREYRATLLELERMEGGKDDPASVALDAISERIARKLSA